MDGGAPDNGFGDGVDTVGGSPAPAAGGADEAAQVLRRLERIEALDRGRAPAGELLGELRELVHEAEAWARVEPEGRSREVVGNLEATGSMAPVGATARAAWAARGNLEGRRKE
jgi:hypothetical protein